MGTCMGSMGISIEFVKRIAGANPDAEVAKAGTSTLKNSWFPASKADPFCVFCGTPWCAFCVRMSGVWQSGSPHLNSSHRAHN